MKTILVVDDDADMRFMLRIILERAHYEVVEAGDGSIAIACIASSMPDLVLTDMRMPVMDGSQLLQTIRSHDATRDLPVILVSAYAVLPDTQQLADMVIAKPFAPDALVQAVSYALRGDRAPRKQVESTQSSTPVVDRPDPNDPGTAMADGRVSD